MASWLLIADLFPDLPVGSQGDWPRVPARACLEGVLERLRAGARWNGRRPLERLTRLVPLSGHLLPSPLRLDPLRRNPRRVGLVAGEAVRSAGPRLRHRDWRRLVLTSQIGGDEVGRCHRGNGPRILLLTDGRGTPPTADTTAANHHEVHTIETLVDERSQAVPAPERLLDDKAADADWLRASLASRGIELICPHRENRTKPPTQDGRSLKRYRYRWVVERTIGWLHHCRRVMTRWEWYSKLFEGFVH